MNPRRRRISRSRRSHRALVAAPGVQLAVANALFAEATRDRPLTPEHPAGVATVADPLVYIANMKSYAAPTLARLRELVATHPGGRVGHRACLDGYNSVMACGTGGHDCGRPQCTFSDASKPCAADDAWVALST